MPFFRRPPILGVDITFQSIDQDAPFNPVLPEKPGEYVRSYKTTSSDITVSPSWAVCRQLYEYKLEVCVNIDLDKLHEPDSYSVFRLDAFIVLGMVDEDAVAYAKASGEAVPNFNLRPISETLNLQKIAADPLVRQEVRPWNLRATPIRVSLDYFDWDRQLLEAGAWWPTMTPTPDWTPAGKYKPRPAPATPAAPLKRVKSLSKLSVIV